MKQVLKDISKFRTTGYLFAMFVIGFIATTCDESFEPREENSEYFFSIYGYLDASVDTQWIRLVPVRDEFDPKPDQIEAEVTIRNIDTGEQAVMDDSLFNPNSLVVYWNFWTTMQIEPEHTYEVVATLPDGESSSTIVTIPPDYPTPINALFFGEEVLIVRNVRNVADVTAVYRVKDLFFNREYVFTYSHIRDSLQSPNSTNELFFRLDYNRDIGLIARQFPDTEWVIEDQQLFVASAGPEWINLYEVDEEIYTLAEGVSNIDNGVGFLLGAVTKTVPWQFCFDTDGTTYIACELETRIR
ncbi:MAG: hypothetical protein ACPGGA_04470 [Balneolaceae bacterium]